MFRTLSGNASLHQAASLYERAVNIEETPERHVFLGEALVLAERKNEALWHYGRAADLYDDREYKVGMPARNRTADSTYLVMSCRRDPLDV